MNRCPRCNGRLIQQADQYGSYICCIYCGNHIEPNIAKSLEAVAKDKAVGRRREPRHQGVKC